MKKYLCSFLMIFVFCRSIFAFANIQNNEEFKNFIYGSKTSEKAIVYGELSVADKVSFSDLPVLDLPTSFLPKGEFSEVKIVKEEYTSRLVPMGKTTGYRSTWETVYNKSLSCKIIYFCGVAFPYSSYAKTIPFVKKGSITKNGYRWIFYSKNCEAKGLSLVSIDSTGDIKISKVHENYGNRKEDFIRFANDIKTLKTRIMFFWFLFLTVIILIVYIVIFLLKE